LVCAGAAFVTACAGVVSSPDESLSGISGTEANPTHTSSSDHPTNGGSGGTSETVGNPGGGESGSSSSGTGGTDLTAGGGSGGASVSGGSGGTGKGSGGGTGVGGAGGAAGSGNAGGSTGTGGAATGSVPLKGLAFQESSTNCGDLDKLKVSWYYNWSASTRCKVSAEYVPQVARAWGTITTAPTPAKVAAAGYKTILGFNEPDQAAQANMSVADVLKDWPAFNQPGMRVGSPATSSSDQGKAWFSQFMTSVQQQGLKVDFIALHWYGWNAGSCTPTANLLEDYIKWAEQWNKPLWLTEWSCHLQSADVSKAFYDGAIAMFKRHPLLERYAWFLSRSTGEFAGAALLDANGNPTALGQDYIAAPAYH
jgi:hypothetical protein